MKKYLGESKLPRVAEKVKERLKKVSVIPASANDREVVLFIGESTEDYTKGHLYQYDEVNTDWVDITGSGGSGSLESSLTASVSVGGISSGTSYETGPSYETIFRDMLNPTQNPSFTSPSGTLSVPGDKLLETGATLNATFTATFNRGSISPAYGTSGYRAGAASSYSFNGGTAGTENVWEDVVVDETNKTFSAVIEYDEGEQPKNNKGEDYSSPLPAGSVTTNTITYEFVDALWANTSSISSIAKLALVSKSAKQKEFNFPASTPATPEVFDVPASWTITSIEVYDDFTKEWQDCSEEFTITDTTHDNAASAEVSYKRYSCNLPYGMDTRKVRIKWN